MAVDDPVQPPNILISNVVVAPCRASAKSEGWPSSRVCGSSTSVCRESAKSGCHPADGGLVIWDVSKSSLIMTTVAIECVAWEKRINSGAGIDVQREIQPSQSSYKADRYSDKGSSLTSCAPEEP